MIDPNTGVYVDPLGSADPGGGGQTGLQILSNMLASHLADTRRQSQELDLAQRQHDYQRQLEYENQIANVPQPFSNQNPGPWADPTDSREEIASQYVSPQSLLSNSYNREWHSQQLGVRQENEQDRAAKNMQDAITKQQDVAVRANWTNAQQAQDAARRGLMDKDYAAAIAAGEHANEPFSPASQSKAALQVAQAGYATARAKTEGEKQRLIDSRLGLAGAQIKELSARADYLAKSGGVLGQHQMSQLTTSLRIYKNQLYQAEKDLDARLGGKNAMPATPEEKADARDRIAELKVDIKNTEDSLQKIGQQSVSPPGSSTPAAPAAPAAVAPPTPVVQPNPAAVKTQTSTPANWQDALKQAQDRLAGH
jgi:hypothetical protein